VLLGFLLLFSTSAISQQVCNLGLPDTWINSTFTSNAAYSNTDIEIAGTITITNGAIISINMSHLYMAPNAKIIINDGAELYLDNNIIEACGSYLWDGIYINQDCFVFAGGNTITDAINTFYSTNGGNYEIYANNFDKCENALTVKDFNGDHYGLFYDNDMSMSQNPLPGGNGTSPAILIEDVVASTPIHTLTIGQIGSTLTNTISGYEDLNIYCVNSDVEIINASINLDAGIEAITFDGGPTANNRRILVINNVTTYTTGNNMANHSVFAMNNFDAQIFENLFASKNYYTHTVLFNSNGEIEYTSNKLNNSQYLGLQITGNSLQTNIDNNDFTYVDNGALINDNNSSTINISNNTFYSPNSTSTSGYGLRIDNCNGFSNANKNIFKINSTGIGVDLINSSNIYIEKNSITQNIISTIPSNTAYCIRIGNSSNNIKINNNYLKFNNNIINGANISIANSFDIKVEYNDMTYGAYGVNTLNSHDIVSKYNMVNHTTYGFYNTTSDIIEINNNTITLNAGHGIYSYGGNYLTVNDNTFTAGTVLSSKTGITVINSHYNTIKGNEIDLNGYNSSNPMAVVGITIENSVNTDVLENTIDNCGYAMYFKQNNSNGIIKCNNMSNSYHGIELYNTIWGESNGSIFEIGHDADPYDNSWYNIAVSNARVKGSIQTYDHDFFYNNSGSEFSLNISQYDVPLGPPSYSIFTSYSTTGQQGGQCGGGQQQKIISDIPLISQSTTDKDNYRQAQIGYAINNLPNSNSLSMSNPQGIYNSILRYNTIRSAYYELQDNSFLTTLGIASDTMYNAFNFSIGASNIGIEYNIENNIKAANYTNALQVLQNYSPQNLAEIYTSVTYQKYIQYLTTDSLSSSDSSNLLIIANNHPNIGGQAVHLARAILGLYIIDMPINAPSSVARTGNTSTNTQTNNPKTDYLNAYPNPANNYYTIDISGDYDNIIFYEIYSITGSLLQSGNINNNSTNKLNISDLNSGIYFIKLFDEDNIIYNNKLIKK